MDSSKHTSHTTHQPSENLDPLTHEKGAHPVGTGIGAAAAGAAVGAAGGAIGGPVGAAVGAVIGGVAGGLAGHSVAEEINPTIENDYWRTNYKSRPYVKPEHDYSEYEPAYRYGWEARQEHTGRSFDEVESDLSHKWDRVRGKSRLDWDTARHATRDAWERLGEQKAPRIP